MAQSKSLTFNKIDRQTKSKCSRFLDEIESLPNLPINLFEDFITWIYERYDLEGFKKSTIEFKKNELKKFLKQCTDKQLQYELKL